MTNQELEHRSEAELSALFRQVSEALTVTEKGSTARRNALASLENISRARTRHFKFPQR
ncbi:MAG: hypothetical protein KDD04_13005 [Sinomicrobium sp.]|nr:hypothetical protein [Sinomicrobium sp.]